jgi:hypothetical protein
MADKFLTLLDMTKRNCADAAVGLIEEVNTVAPELMELKGRPIDGNTYKVKKRIALPSGPVFRNANEGSDIISSSYAQEIGQCFFLDGQLRVDEAVITSGESEGNSMAEVLADEATGVIRQQMVKVGDCFYRGTTADAKGFVGLQSFYDTTNCEVSAGGTTSGARCSAWLVWNDPQGVYWVWGQQRGLQLGNWSRQQVNDSSGKSYFAWVNNLSGWIGLGLGHTKSVVRIKFIENTSGKYLTDALVAEAISKLPIFMRRSPGLRLFMNSTAQLTLQKSRSTVNTAKTDSAILQFAPPPVESNGVQIILTDSLPQTE